MMEETFVDGVLGAGLMRGMLRIDFFSVSPPKAAGGEEEKVLRQRLVMTPQGFAEAYATFTQIMTKLREGGLLGVEARGPMAVPGEGQKADSNGEGETRQQQSPSPNF